jgi:HK97 family phage major capsid protein
VTISGENYLKKGIKKMSYTEKEVIGIISELGDKFNLYKGKMETRFQGYDDEINNLKEQAGAIEKAVAIGQSPGGGFVSGAAESQLASSKFGFENLGHLALDIRQAAVNGGRPSGRITQLVEASASTYSTEGVGADGGLLVPPDYSTQIMGDILEPEGILGRCDSIPVVGNSFVSPTDETTPWGATGIQAYWENEAEAFTQSKMKLETNTQRLGKITALIPVSDELLEDSVALSVYLQRKINEIFRFKITLAIIQGSGVGQPLGIMNSGCLKTVAKESGQTADTIVVENIFKMEAGMMAEHRKNAVWLGNSTILPQIRGLYLIVGDGGIPVYMPQAGMSANPFNTLSGLPVVYTEACEPLGDLGDIILADLSQYRVIYKSSGIQSDVSMHVWFDQGLTAFRFVMRISGQPWRSSVITGRDGSTTYSPFVTLAERAEG